MKADFEKMKKFPEKIFQNFVFYFFSVPKLKLLKNIGNFFVSGCWYPYATQRIGSAERGKHREGMGQGLRGQGQGRGGLWGQAQVVLCTIYQPSIQYQERARIIYTIILRAYMDSKKRTFIYSKLEQHSHFAKCSLQN